MKDKQNKSAERNVSALLKFFGEDVDRGGLKETPARVVRMYRELLDGYTQDEARIFKVFGSNGYHDLVTVSIIDFYSLC